LQKAATLLQLRYILWIYRSYNIKFAKIIAGSEATV